MIGKTKTLFMVRFPREAPLIALTGCLSETLYCLPRILADHSFKVRPTVIYPF